MKSVISVPRRASPRRSFSGGISTQSRTTEISPRLTSNEKTYYVPSINRTSRTNRCIVLDLDETLLSSKETQNEMKINKILDKAGVKLKRRMYKFKTENLDELGSGSISYVYGVTRPHLSEFLIFCFTYFKVVAVWSAGGYDYVHNIVNTIFSRSIRYPDIVWTRLETEFPKTGVLKPLVKMINSNDSMDLSNTLIVDDNVTTYILNPDNAINIPVYRTADTIESMSLDDPSLLQLMKWFQLREVMEAEDVRDLDKSSIFNVTLDEYDTILQNENRMNS